MEAKVISLSLPEKQQAHRLTPLLAIPCQARAAGLNAKTSGQTFSMTRGDSWAESAKDREALACQPSFKSAVPHLTPGADNSSALWKTTTQGAYGTGDGPEARMAKTAALRSSEAPWVVGRGGARLEKGRSTSGCLGEVYKASPDMASSRLDQKNATSNPQIRTASQRTWLYYKDPMLVLKEGEYVPPPREELVSSLPGVGEREAAGFDPERNNKRVAKLTRYSDPKMHPLPGSRVFADQDEAVPVSGFKQPW